MNITLVAAIGKNRELGKKGDLIWRNSEDLLHFKWATMGGIVIMGSKTHQSLPKELDGRFTIVLTRDPAKCSDGPLTLPVYALGQTLLQYASSKEQLLAALDDYFQRCSEYKPQVFVVGGGSIYEEFIDIATSMILTEIDAEDSAADVYFPKFGYEWMLIDTRRLVWSTEPPVLEVCTYTRRPV